MKATAAHFGTPEKATSDEPTVIDRFEDGDLLFGLQTDRAAIQRALEEKGIQGYITIDQVNNTILSGNSLAAENINTRNRAFLTSYSEKLKQNDMKRDNRIRTSCQLTIDLITHPNNLNGPKIHFILDDLVKLENLHDSTLEGFTSAELHAAFRTTGKNIIWWFKGEEVSFAHARALTVGEGAIADKKDSPLEKLPRGKAMASSSSSSSSSSSRRKRVFSERKLNSPEAQTASPAEITEGSPQAERTSPDLRRARLSKSPGISRSRPASPQAQGAENESPAAQQVEASVAGMFAATPQQQTKQQPRVKLKARRSLHL